MTTLKEHFILSAQQIQTAEPEIRQKLSASLKRQIEISAEAGILLTKKDVQDILLVLFPPTNMSVLSMLKKQIADELGEESQVAPECQRGLVTRFRFDMEHQYRHILQEPEVAEVEQLLAEAEERLEALLAGV